MPIHTALELKVGSIVRITDEDFWIYDSEGIVVDTNSDAYPEDGPIAVFFDKEVETLDIHGPEEAESWSGPIPTQENYRECPRVLWFQPNELMVISQFSLKTLADRRFPGMWHHTRAFSAPLVPNVFKCHLADCKSGLMATERSLFNFWGTVIDFYTCTECHEAIDGMGGDFVPKLREPDENDKAFM